MTGADLQALLPLILVAASVTVVMVGIAVRRNHGAALGLTLLGLAAAFCSLFVVSRRQVTSLLVMDSYAVFYMGLMLAAAFAVALLAYGYLEKREDPAEEFYILLLAATFGSMVLVSSSHFVSFFLGLEILSVALYALIAYARDLEQPLEAGIKYLVLAATSAAFLLFGIALVYTELGTLEFSSLVNSLTARSDLNLTLVLPGITMIITGVGFKLALVPFHLWTPDVYEGAPAPVSAFVATVSKGSVFALLLRYAAQSEIQSFTPIFLVFSIIAIVSMFAGNLLALLQNNVKRILAYSSIAHIGYLLVAFQAGGSAGARAATFYLVAYFIMTLGAFGVVTVLSGGEKDADTLDDYRGLFWRRPPIALVFTIMLLSLAGIPLTAGFLGKFLVVASGASSGAWALILVLVLTSSIGLFYYLRIIGALYGHGKEREQSNLSSTTGAFVLGVLTVALICLGVYPAPLLKAIQAAVTGLT